MKTYRHLTLGLLLVFSAPALAASSECDEADLADTAIEAALGERTGLYNLGVEFYKGTCVKQSYGKAALFWERAVALDHNRARNNLGYLMYNGLGVPKDEARAVSLWKHAAEAGVSEAQVHLGDALFDGRGIDMDRVLGLAWVLRGMQTASTSSGDNDRTENEIRKMAETLSAKMQAEDASLLTPATELAKRLPSKTF